MAAPQETEDPLEKGSAPWQEHARYLAHTWADQLDLNYLGMSLMQVLEYPMLDAINRLYERANDG